MISPLKIQILVVTLTIISGSSLGQTAHKDEYAENDVSYTTLVEKIEKLDERINILEKDRSNLSANLCSKSASSLPARKGVRGEWFKKHY